MKYHREKSREYSCETHDPYFYNVSTKKGVVRIYEREYMLVIQSNDFLNNFLKKKKKDMYHSRAWNYFKRSTTAHPNLRELSNV